MITSFRCRETERIFKGKFSATLPQAIQKAAARKLEIIDAARDLEDLRTPPGNWLEARNLSASSIDREVRPHAAA